MLEGLDPSGQPVLIRRWPKSKQTLEDGLTEIWRDELRALHRLSAAPNSSGVIAPLVDAGEDDDAFYVVLSVGQRRPLAKQLDKHSISGGAWLRAPNLPRNRRLIWKNLSRIAKGLDLLHSYGFIHCNLDEWSILTTGNANPDFQLTGFEWSLRLVGSERKRNSRRTSVPTPISFIDDWASFALLASRLIKAPEKKVLDKRIPSHEVSENLLADEVAFIRDLLFPSEISQIDGEFVQKRLDAICDNLEQSAASSDARYFLSVFLGRDSRLSEAIREVSGRSVQLSDEETQLNFIRADTNSDLRVIIVENEGGASLVLRGHRLCYHLKSYRLPKTSHQTWEVAYCDNATPVEKWGAPIIGSAPITSESLSVISNREAVGRIPRLRGRTREWQEFINRFKDKVADRLSETELTLRGLQLLHLVEVAITAAEVFPVKVIDKKIDDATELFIKFRVSYSKEHNDLSDGLGLPSASERLVSVLERDALPADEGWLLTDNAKLGRRSGAHVELQFEKVDHSETGPEFVFRCSQNNSLIPTEGYLVAGGVQGTLIQHQRRSRAISYLRDHIELTKMLSDPYGRSVSSHEKVAENFDGFNQLDDAKKKAFREIIEVLPLYLVQGPPGVGKTFLIRELVGHQFFEDQSTRLLLSAQSHHALDHLLSELSATWAGKDILAVRCKGAEQDEEHGEYSARVQADVLLNTFIKSDMAKTLSANLSSKLNLLSNIDGTFTPDETRQKVNIEKRALDDLAMRAANVVLATTNSSDLERLSEMRSNFDWAVVEEAAKATGVELLLPMLLSHRRLLIGDHKQLPPFGINSITKLLENPDKLRETLLKLDTLVERYIIDSTYKDIRSVIEVGNDSDFATICSDALRALSLFETMIEEEKSRQSRPAVGLSISSVLNLQHRMHPDIATLVSDCFYDGGLGSAETVFEKFSDKKCPVVIKQNSTLPSTPTVIVDMPYQQSRMGIRRVEQYPRFTNPAEIEATKKVLKALSVDHGVSGQPSLAILSPYSRQVSAISAAIKEDDECLSILEKFRAVARGQEWCSTVDAFQGNEADVVIVSLVRNNHHSNLRQALGFLTDERRMNVLFSRARWKLILITSLDFIKTVIQPMGDGFQDANFLHRLVENIELGKDRGAISVISEEKLAGGAN